MRIKGAFFISWIIASITMYAESYVWHGVVLTDLHRIRYPLNIFLLCAALAYLLIGFLVSFNIEFFPFFESRIKKVLATGVFSGISIYLVAFVFGISFYAMPEWKHVVMDISWQIIEQTIGGFVYLGVYKLLELKEEFNKL